MFGFTKRKENVLSERVAMLEDRIIELSKEKHELIDTNFDLITDNKKLKQTRQMEDEMIAHKLKMREEVVQLDADKRVSKAERKAAADKDDGIATVKDKYRDKLENQLEKRGDEMKEMYGKILKRLPDVTMAITKEIKEKVVAT